ncbi:MAG TPA: copper homeostasis membrane protein CopD [Aliidongia sp.]|uniref:copper homeostasis membrane protein CopD n=1 Tax=Aliidongia sp. TaxID=1914230 RepID=UPI002DDD0234|nr:copper homeostasis membrane protein CopD [Aliidongia sp.]HEV2673744.1 copper homeostasis membrane protein CopD [Aliidongia sp.]
MSPEAALLVVRFVHFWAVFGLFGTALFGLYAGGAARALVAPKLGGPVALMSITLLGSGVIWLLVESAHFCGDWSGATDADMIGCVLFQTGFGKLWMWRLLLAASLLPIATMERGPARDGLLIAVSAMLAGSLGLTGHAAMDTGLRGALHQADHAIHLLAVGAWLGGLLPLARLLAERPAVEVRADALHRFSTVGIIAVGLILVTGIANATMIAGSPIPSLATAWGRTLAVKLLLVAIMIAAALVNRLILMPSARYAAIGRLVMLEQALGLAVLAAASLLGTLPPDGAM